MNEDTRLAKLHELLFLAVSLAYTNGTPLAIVNLSGSRESGGWGSQ